MGARLPRTLGIPLPKSGLRRTWDTSFRPCPDSTRDGVRAGRAIGMGLWPWRRRLDTMADGFISSFPYRVRRPHRLTRLGHRVFIPAMRVQIPLGSFHPTIQPIVGFFVGPACLKCLARQRFGHGHPCSRSSSLTEFLKTPSINRRNWRFDLLLGAKRADFRLK